MSMQLLTFKTPIGYNKAKPIAEYFALVIFGLFYFQEKFERSIVL